MAIRRILRMGDPRLLQVSAPVSEFDTPELHALIADMQETMAAANGAGLAAPQIGVPLRVVLFGGAPSVRYPDAEAVPATVLINPLLEPLDADQEDGWEGCLSVPGLRGTVPRFTALRYAGWNARGERFERSVSGFHARVVQHEVDHLDGILFPHRMHDLRTLGFTEELFPGQVLGDD